MSTNLKRAYWAEVAIIRFVSMTKAEAFEDAIGDLIANLGHLAQAKGLDFLDLVRTGIGHWHLEQTDEDSIDVLPTVTITINESTTNA